MTVVIKGHSSIRVNWSNDINTHKDSFMFVPCVMSVLCTHPHIKCHFTFVQLLHFEAGTTWLFCAFLLHVVLVDYFYFYSLDWEAVDLCHDLDISTTFIGTLWVTVQGLSLGTLQLIVDSGLTYHLLLIVCTSGDTSPPPNAHISSEISWTWHLFQTTFIHCCILKLQSHDFIWIQSMWLGCDYVGQETGLTIGACAQWHSNSIRIRSLSKSNCNW